MMVLKLHVKVWKKTSKSSLKMEELLETLKTNILYLLKSARKKKQRKK